FRPVRSGPPTGQKSAPGNSSAHVGAAGLLETRLLGGAAESSIVKDCAHYAPGLSSGGKIASRIGDVSERAEENFRYQGWNPRIASKRRSQLGHAAVDSLTQYAAYTVRHTLCGVG